MEVKVYSTPTCPMCKMLKAWLDQHKIKYESIDVTVNEEARNRIMAKGAQGVPVTEIDGQFIMGFNKSKLGPLLNIA